MGLLLEGPVGHGQDPQGLVRVAVVGRHDPRAVGLGEGPLRAVLQDGDAVAQEQVGGPLGQGHEVAAVPPDDGHLLAFGVEGDLLDELVGLGLGGLPDAGLGGGAEDGDLGRVAEDLGPPVLAPQLGVVAEDADGQGPAEVGVGPGIDRPGRRPELADRVVAGARDLIGGPGGPDGPDGHLVLGQRAGLVRADDRGAAERLDRGQLADEDVAPDHALDAQGQGDGHDRRQALGDGGHGQADRGQKHVEELAAPQDLQPEDDGDEGEAQVDEDLAELLELALQRRRLLPDALDQAGDAAELGLHAGLDDQGPGLAGDDRRPHVEDVGPFGQGDFLLLEGDVGLGDRRRLPGQAGFLDGEVRGVPDDPAVGRDVVAGLDLDEIAGDELAGRDEEGRTAADGLGAGRGQAPQSGQALLGPVFLDQAEDGVEDDDGQDGHGVHPFLEEARDQGGGDEDADHEALELVEEDGQGAPALLLLELVRAEGGQLAGRGLRRQARLQVRLQLAGDLIGREMPPVRHRPDLR